MKIFLIAHVSKVLGYHAIGKWTIGRFLGMAMRQLGHEVEFYDYVKDTTSTLAKLPILSLPSVYPKIQNLIIKGLDERIMKRISRFSPDAVVVVKGERITSRVLKWIRTEMDIPLVNWIPDDPQLFDSFSKYVAPYYDYIFSSSTDTLPKYGELGVRSEWIGFACDPRFHRRIDVYSKELGSDLCFIGTCYPERIVALSPLVKYDLKIWGSRWTLQEALMKLFLKYLHRSDSGAFLKEFKTILSTKLWQKCMGINPDLVRSFNSSKIILNIHHDLMKEGGMKANLKVYEATGCGSFLLTDEPKGLRDLFKVGRELVCFEDPADLVEKVEFYLANSEERMEIARKGQLRTYKDHTYVQRAKQILSRVRKLKKRRK